MFQPEAAKNSERALSEAPEVKESSSSDFVCPSELNTFLLNRIRELKSENGRLRQELDGAKRTLEEVQKTSSEENGALKKRKEAAELSFSESNERCESLRLDLEKLRAISSEENGLLKRCKEAAEVSFSESNERCESLKVDLEKLKAKCEALEENLASREVEMEAKRRESTKSFEDSTTMTEDSDSWLSLRDRLAKKDEQFRILREKLEQTSIKLGETRSSCSLLRKKVRKMQRECEVEKTKRRKIEEKMARKLLEEDDRKSSMDLESKRSEAPSSKEATTMTEQYIDDKPSTSPEENHFNEKDERVRGLMEKLQQANAKLYETKNSCTSLRQEVNKAQKLLCREVGEGVTIASLGSRPSGWRGRAEQVQQLQQRLAELQSKLSEQEKSRSSSSFGVLSEQRNLDYLRSLETERRRQIENSTKELRQTEEALEACQKKFQAARARIRVLENELATSKTNLRLLNERRVHDDQLVEALNGQLKAVEERHREREHEARYRKEKAEERCREVEEELNAVKLQAQILRKRLEEREAEIENLRSGAQRPRIPRAALKPEDEISGPVISRSATPRVIGEPNEYVTMSLAAEAERQRLLELVALLNRRLDKERTDGDRVSELLREEKSNSRKLEAKLRGLEASRVGMSKINTGYRARGSWASLKSRENLSSEQIQFKLELLEEECLALKTRLTTVLQEKTTDLAIYKKMLEQARRTFQDAFRGKMNHTAGCHSNASI